MERGKGIRYNKKSLTLQVLRAVTDITYVILLNMIIFVNVFAQFVLSRGFKVGTAILE
jgi:hypothetical protein